MPGYDGTGPKGRGPLTGAGRGCCMLKMPRAGEEVVTGFVGLAGKPVSLAFDASRADDISKRQNVKHRNDTGEGCSPPF